MKKSPKASKLAPPPAAAKPAETPPAAQPDPAPTPAGPKSAEPPKPAAAPESATSGASPPESSPEFFVAGIGASAGGLEAMTEVLKRLPPKGNLAVVIVQHLDPHHDSILVDILNRVSKLPVQWVTHGRAVQPGRVYVAPPRKCVAIKEGVLLLHEPNGAGSHKAGGDVNYFFQHLASEYGHCAVGVILSGNGADGTTGARAINGAGGVVFAQEPKSAGFPSMPQSAIDAKCVDAVLKPAAIAEELVKLTQHAPALWTRIAAPDEAPPAGDEATQLAAIFRLLAGRTGVDFGEYKQSTIKRRLVRQMMLAKTSELGDYVKLLHKDREESARLYESLLINVTEFFRDAEYFDFLRERVLPELLGRAGKTPVRMWVPGCATGEEVYSLGMLVRELLAERGQDREAVIFGTDASERAVAQARSGQYAAADVAGLSPERLQRFFLKTDRGYTIRKDIRDMCIFARQNLVKDSPFSRLDLISCRNLMIYLGPGAQRRLMPVFHYALNPGGTLVLGTSESVGAHADLFRVVDRRFRIYTSKSTGRRTVFEVALDPARAEERPPAKPVSPMPDSFKEPFDVMREADRIVLNRHGPVGVLVNEELEILQFRGDVSPYLTLAAGRASLNLLKLARDGLGGQLKMMIDEARDKNARVHRGKMPVMLGDKIGHVDMDVTPISGAHTKEHFYLVLFQLSQLSQLSQKGKKGSKASFEEGQVEQLRQDLAATRNYLQSTVEKHESTTQELRAANEEIQSSNEELQSTNEELETAKEELQSTNEELTTVNEELHSRQLELMQLNNDLNNLITSIHLPIIILGPDLRIRRFTTMAEKILNVIPSDIGRPLSDINIRLNVKELPKLIHEVTESLTVKEIEVQDSDGHWYSLRLRPYKTAENKIEGVVMALIDIDQVKRATADAEDARDFAQAVVVSTPEPLAVMSADLKVISANDAIALLLRTTRESIVNRSFFDAIHDAAASKKLRTALEGILPNKRSLTDYAVSMELPEIGACKFRVEARPITNGTRSYPMILLSMHAQP